MPVQISMNHINIARRLRDLAERVLTINPPGSRDEYSDPSPHEECAEIARDLDRVANEIALGAAGGEGSRKGRGRIVSSEVRRINGRSVTVQRKRSAFAIFVNG
jgi:hypothetical protein